MAQYNVSLTDQTPINVTLTGVVLLLSSIIRSVIIISTPTNAGNAALTDYVYIVSGVTTLTLPTAISNTNRYTAKNSGVSTITVATSLSQTIDGNATINISPGFSADLISDNANWRVV